MPDRDWAVIVGIDHYPGLINLMASERDSNAFADWVSSPTGGAVPHDHISILLSSSFPGPTDVYHARPDASDVLRVFDNLRDIGIQHQSDIAREPFGRRLYIYLAGHGISVSSEDNALLLANATRDRLGYNFPGTLWGKWFLSAGIFREVVVFMDCSRELVRQAPLMIPPYIPITYPNPTGWFFSASSGSGLQRSVDGLMRGVFTTALLVGLRGAACDPEGRITSESLAAYLMSAEREFVPEELRRNPRFTAQEPHISYSGASGESVLLKLSPSAIPRSAVNLKLSPSSVGQRIEILGSSLEIVASVPAAVSPEMQFSLPRGVYMARVGSVDRLFQVRGTGDIDVRI